MKICFIGLGSIGKRHLRNVCTLLNKRKIPYTIDALRSSTSTVISETDALVNKQYYDLNNLDDDYDIIFVTNPTIFHAETIQRLINKTKHMFIEKPVFQKYECDLKSWMLKSDSIYYVACPLRHSPIIKYIKNNINPDDVFSIRAISSSYLPSWRAGVDYRNNYSAHSELGGGVTLDLIHEIDYITFLFGFPETAVNVKGHFSALEINSDDLSLYILKYKDKLAEIHLDYFGKSSIRYVELFCKHYVIKGDFISNKISYLINGTEEIIELPFEEDYIIELNYFFDLIEKKCSNINDIYYANQVLKIATHTTKELLIP